MAHFNTSDANPHFTSSVCEELDPYSVLGQALAGEWADIQASDTPIHGLGMVEQPGLMVGSSSSRATTSYEPVASANPYTTELNSYGQLTYPGHSWQTVGHQTQSHNSGFQSQDDFFQGTTVLESSAVVPTPSSSLLDYWGTSQSGPFMSTFYTQNVQSSYQPGTGSTRAGSIPMMRFQPYGVSCTHPNEYRDAETGTSTLVPPSASYVGPPTPQPSGGISETTVGAEDNNTTKDEDKAATTEETRCPRGQGRHRPHRTRTQALADMLRTWVQRYKGLREPPSLNRALEVAAGIIPRIRPLAHQEPRLRTGEGKRKATRSRHVDAEIARREVERGLLQNLSRYYPLGQGQKRWNHASLLSQVMEDPEDLSALPGPSDEPDP